MHQFLHRNQFMVVQCFLPLERQYLKHAKLLESACNRRWRTKETEIRRGFAAVTDTRKYQKINEAKHAMPNIEVDPQTYEVFANGGF